MLVLPDGAGTSKVVVREQPDDFNGLKASLAFFNVDASCADASLRPAGRTADLFKRCRSTACNVAFDQPGEPVGAVRCANANVGAPLTWGNSKRVSATACCWCRRPQDHVLNATDSLSHRSDPPLPWFSPR